MSDLIKAGFLQFKPILGDQQQNISRISLLLKQATDADLIVIPELANSGYNFESKEQALKLAEEINKSVFVEFLIEEARKHNLFLVSGINEIDKGKLYNSSILVSPNGLIGKYRKIHLFLNEFDFFEKGNLGFPVFDIGFCRIGMLICFDWVFSEAWRVLALKGADIICHPSNLVLPYSQQAVPVHGMVNRTFNITANRYGTEREVTFSGKSIISDPYGNTLVTGSPDNDGVQFLNMDLSLARNKMITPRNHAINDRQPEEYKYICDK